MTYFSAHHRMVYSLTVIQHHHIICNEFTWECAVFGLTRGPSKHLPERNSIEKRKKKSANVKWISRYIRKSKLSKGMLETCNAWSFLQKLNQEENRRLCKHSLMLPDHIWNKLRHSSRLYTTVCVVIMLIFTIWLMIHVFWQWRLKGRAGLQQEYTLLVSFTSNPVAAVKYRDD